jgi:hypothetical protein
MAETVEQVQDFNAVEYLKQANETEAAAKAGKPLPEPVKAVETKEPKPAEGKAAEPTGDGKDDDQPRLPRSARREMNRLREEAAELRGRLKAIEELGLSPKKEQEAKKEADPEPVRTDYSSEADYNRALGRWDARQEVKKVETNREQTAEQQVQAKAFQEHCAAMDKKAVEDIKAIKDWDEVQKAVADADEVLEFKPEEHPTLMGLIASSDTKAYVLYHFAKVPADLQKMLDLTSDPGAQIRQFARLEGRIEKLYSTNDSTKAAQASDEPKGDDSKDRKAPAEGNTSERDARKPRPTSEVAARGGSAVPEEPAPGSKAWMERENLKYSSKTPY